jgi:hypothetical protein
MKKKKKKKSLHSFSLRALMVLCAIVEIWFLLNALYMLNIDEYRFVDE